MGQLTASVTASALFALLDNRIVLWSAVLLLAAMQLIALRGSLKKTADADEMATEEKAKPDTGPKRY